MAGGNPLKLNMKKMLFHLSAVLVGDSAKEDKNPKFKWLF